MIGTCITLRGINHYYIILIVIENWIFHRLVWAVLVLTCVVLTFLSYFNLAERHDSYKLQIVVEDSQLPVFEIPFPAVAVCPKNKVNWQLYEAARERFLPKTVESDSGFQAFVEKMETLSFGNFRRFQNMDNLNLEELNMIDITILAQFLALKCENIFYNDSCHWRGVAFPCCDGFTFENTEHGMCLVFNSLISDTSKNIQVAFYFLLRFS